MFNYLKRFLYSIGIMLFVLPGCTKQSSQTLDPLISNPSYESQLLSFCVDKTRQFENDINVFAYQMNTLEVNYLLNGRGHVLYDSVKKSPIVPLYIEIYNLTNEAYIISPDKIMLPLVPCDRVFSLIKNNTKKIAGVHAAVGAAAGLTFIPLLDDVPNRGVAGGIAKGLVGGVMGALGGLAVSSADCLRSYMVNRQIKKDLKNKTLWKKMEIRPGEVYQKLIFVNDTALLTSFTMIFKSSLKKDKDKAINILIKKNYLL